MNKIEPMNRAITELKSSSMAFGTQATAITKPKKPVGSSPAKQSDQNLPNY